MVTAAEALVTSSAVDAPDLALQAFATPSPGQPYWLELGERTVSVLSRAQRANDTIAVADRLLATVDDVDCRNDWRRRTNRAATGRGGLAGWPSSLKLG